VKVNRKRQSLRAAIEFLLAAPADIDRMLEELPPVYT